MSDSNLRLRLGTRTSKLALWQTQHIIEQLQLAWHGLECEVIHFSTVGDKTQSEGKPLPEVGGKGVFTAELEEALHAGSIDLAVHSLKDLPVENSHGLLLGAITKRADVRDVLIARNGWTLATLPQGAHVGTSSTRRAAQLRALRPDLVISSIRGNLDTRIRKVQNGDYDATLLALAGIDRLQLNDVVSEVLPLDVMLPAPGQGALAVQCRADDQTSLRLLAAIDDQAVRAAITAERAFLAALGGGCSAPVAAYAHFTDAENFDLQTLVAATDGSTIVRLAESCHLRLDSDSEGAAWRFGEQLAQRSRAMGAEQILQQSSLFKHTAPPALAGKRIVITRRPQQSQELIRGLTGWGATPISLPVIDVVPIEDQSELDAALHNLSSFDWLVFTSANAVDIFFERMQAKEINPQNAPKITPQIAVVGKATAQALKRFSLQAAAQPASAAATAIADALGEVTGKKVLLAQAAIARRNLAEALQSAGAQVTAIAIYDTVAIEPAAEALAEFNKGIDAIIFTSGSTVKNFAALLHKHNLPMPTPETRIFCIGPITAEDAEQAGFHNRIIADEQTNQGILQAIIQTYS